MSGSAGQPSAVIVGIGPGLGTALAERFGRGGFAVTGLGRNPSRMPEAGIDVAAADAGRAEDLRAALARIGPVSMLIYNAYRMTQSEGPASLDPEQVVEDFRVNVAGALVAAQAVLPAMRAAGKGTILFTRGGIGKAGLRSLALSMHKELAPTGIHVGTVTIAGQIQPGGSFDPARIADAFWSMHTDSPDAFRAELVFKG